MKDIKVCLNRHSWCAGKLGTEYSSWFIRLECICMQIELKKEAGDCLPLNRNAMQNISVKTCYIVRQCSYTKKSGTKKYP